MLQTTIVMKMDHLYPFKKPQQPNKYHQSNKLIKQIVNSNQSTHNGILSKAMFIKNLRNRFLVRMQCLQVEDHQIHLSYEYFEAEDWKKIYESRQKILIVNQHLNKLAIYLRNIGLKTEFSKDRIGLTLHGSLKYFIGLQFEYDSNDDESYLKRYYENNIAKIFDSCLKNNTTECSNSDKQPISQSNRQRKVSFMTLPSRKNRLNKLNLHLTGLKDKVKEISKPGNQRNHSPRSINNLNGKSLKKQTPHENNDRNRGFSIYSNDANYDQRQNRKFSYNQKGSFQFNRKLLDDKDSDIKSEKIIPMANKLARAQQKNSDSRRKGTRAQYFNHHQYLRLANNNQQYYEDFSSVLENAVEPSEKSNKLNPVIKSRSSSNLLTSQNSLLDRKMSPQAIKIKTRQVIEQSRKVMNKFKGIK